MNNTYIVRHLMNNGSKGKTYIMASTRDKAFDIFHSRFGYHQAVFGVDIYIDNTKK